MSQSYGLRIIKYFRKEHNLIKKEILKYGILSDFCKLFHNYEEASAPMQTFNFWKATMKLNGKFKLYSLNPKIDLLVIDDKITSEIDLEEIRILFLYYFPKLSINIIYKRTSEILDSLSLVVRHKDNHKQYEALSLSQYLLNWKSKSSYGIIGLLNQELYYDNSSFVLGQSFCKFGSAVICLKKYKETTIDRSELNLRLVKALLHETSHLFGIQHCSSYHCIMNSSTSLAKARLQPLAMCPMCLAKLQHILKFDPFLRYQSLQQYFIKILSCSQHAFNHILSIQYYEFLMDVTCFLSTSCEY